jgi:hypothetical protein
MKRRIALVVVLTLIAGALGVGVTLAVRPDAPPRDIVLTARGMAFFLDGDNTPNPAIAVTPGEHIRFILRNDAPGLMHDLYIPALGVDLQQISAGESRAVMVRIPQLAGPAVYLCRPHAQMMKGQVVPAGF